MSQQSPLVNRVAQSGLITLDLADYLPEEPIVAFDLKDYLVQETMLMEKPFRASLKELDWSNFADKTVTIYCSVDTIIPKWAYMLVASYLQVVTNNIYFGSIIATENTILLNQLNAIDANEYNDSRVVVKGCGKRDIPAEAYLAITQKLQPVVKSLMYGEPCSTVPVYKQPKP